MIKWFLLAILCLMNVAQANIIMGTRVIYPSDEKVVSVDLHNPDDTPSLVQAWIDNSNPTNVTKKVPFVITPMVGRVEPKSRQSLRIRQVGDDLPKDRESVFYLNILDIPAKPKDAGDNYLQITLNNRLKFFYRPSKLPYPVTEAYDKITWHWTDKTLTLNNPTPYYITYAGVVLRHGERVLYETSDIDMIAPFDTLMLSVEIDDVPSQIDWHIINDYGAISSGKSLIQQ